MDILALGFYLLGIYFNKIMDLHTKKYTTASMIKKMTLVCLKGMFYV
jgi:hypothetical protein